MCTVFDTPNSFLRIESTVFRSSFNITATFSNLKLWLGGHVMLELKCKGYSPPNDHTTSASSTPLPPDSWNLNTGTRPTESETSARVARKRARYAQRTERQRLHDAHQKCMPGSSWLQHLGGASPATGECGLLHSDLKTRFCS